MCTSCEGTCSCKMRGSSGQLFSVWRLEDPGCFHLVVPPCEQMPSTIAVIWGNQELALTAMAQECVSHCCSQSLSWSLSHEGSLTVKERTNSHSWPLISTVCYGTCTPPINRLKVIQILKDKVVFQAVCGHWHSVAPKAHILSDKPLYPAVLSILELSWGGTRVINLSVLFGRSKNDFLRNSLHLLSQCS